VWAQGRCNTHYAADRRTGKLEVLPPKSRRERFWEKVDKTADCWIWTGALHGNTGYAIFGVSKGKTTAAHRFAYEDAVGPIPPGYHVDHLCFNRTCVNPAHLRVVTQAQNNQHYSGPTKRNKSGYLGVYWHKGAQKWAASVRHKGKNIHLGMFENAAEAGEAARKKRNELFTHNDKDRIST
jgi:hypothetical protein